MRKRGKLFFDSKSFFRSFSFPVAVPCQRPPQARRTQSYFPEKKLYANVCCPNSPANKLDPFKFIVSIIQFSLDASTLSNDSQLTNRLCVHRNTFYNAEICCGGKWFLRVLMLRCFYTSSLLKYNISIVFLMHSMNKINLTEKTNNSQFKKSPCIHMYIHIV